MKNIDQEALKREIGKQTLANFGLHFVGIFEVWWFITSIMTGAIISAVFAGVFAVYFAYNIAKRRAVIKSLLEMVNDR